MAVHPHIEIVSVNMCRCNTITHALLNSATNTNILLIQEPWYKKIGTNRSDSAKEGTDTLGGVGSPAWEVLYLGLSENQ